MRISNEDVGFGSLLFSTIMYYRFCKFVTLIISHALGLKINLKVRELKQKYRDTIGNQKAALLPPINWSGRATDTVPDDNSDAEDGNE